MKTLLLLIFSVLFSNFVYADVALLVHEAKGFSGEMTGAGHSAVYLSELCADPPPFVLRKCKGAEKRGAVIATYPDFGSQAEYKWFSMPLDVYLYGVEEQSQIPIYANGEIRLLLRETVRRKYLNDVVPRATDGSIPAGRWTEIIGTALNRDLYAFTVKTTPEQDEAFMKKYGQLKEGNDFNLLYKNCADFTAELMNFYFPGSSRRDFINDMTMTTPKGITRSFTKYAKKRPELLFHVKKYSQLDGPIMRSFGNRNFVETAFTSKKYVVTQSLTMPVLLPFFATTYFLTGYFSIDKTYEEFPTPEMARLNLDKKIKKNINNFSENSSTIAEIDRRRKSEKERVFGTSDKWKDYKNRLKTLLDKAISQKLFADKDEIKSFYKDLEAQSEPFFDGSGNLALKVDYYGKEAILGITNTNILNPNYDARLAYKLMLIKLKYQLEASKKNRVTFDELTENWGILTMLKEKISTLPPMQIAPNQRFLTTPIKVSGGKKFANIFRKITH